MSCWKKTKSDAASARGVYRAIHRWFEGIKAGPCVWQPDFPGKGRNAFSISGGKIRVLVATHGGGGVDNPNATIMVIEALTVWAVTVASLRGRVGRGDKRSWCFLRGRKLIGSGAVRQPGWLPLLKKIYNCAGREFLGHAAAWTFCPRCAGVKRHAAGRRNARLCAGFGAKPGGVFGRMDADTAGCYGQI